MTNKEFSIGWIAGMPRSGTTWLSQIFASSSDVRLKFCPLFSYEFKNILNEQSTVDEWHKLFFDVYHTKSEYLDQDYLRKQGLVPKFDDRKESPKHLMIKSTRFHNLIPHILSKDLPVKFVHIVRNPCANIHSWLTNPHEFPADADPKVEWRTGECRKNGPGEFWGFDDWVKVTTEALMLSKKYPDKFRVIQYETLVKETEQSVRELFSFFNIPYGEQTADFINMSQTKHDSNKRSVFKDPAQKESWSTLLDPEIISSCRQEVSGTELEKFLNVS